MINKGRKELLVRGKVSYLVKYLMQKYKLKENNALRVILKTDLYQLYLSNLNTELWSESPVLLLELFDVEYKQGKEALKKYLDETYFY